MFKTFKTLPDHYTLHSSINLTKNIIFAIILNIFSVILFVIPFIILAFIQDLVAFDFIQLFIAVGLSVIYIFFHEWVHAIVFQLKNRDTVKVKYAVHLFAASAGVPGVYFQRNHYLLVSLAPFVITTILLVPLMIIANSFWFFILYFLFAFNLSGSIGDFYLFFKLLFMDKNLLIEDYGPGMNFYLPTNVVDE